jgi:hypothetical protein
VYDSETINDVVDGHKICGGQVAFARRLL